MKTYVLIFLFLSYTNSYAYVIDIKSGEHENFTRLVFYHPNDVQLQLRKSENEFSVGSFEQVTTLNMNEVFTRIARDRISDIQLESGRVFVATSCACDASLSVLRPGVSYVDVENRPADEQISKIELESTIRPEKLFQNSDFTFPITFISNTSPPDESKPIPGYEGFSLVPTRTTDPLVSENNVLQAFLREIGAAGLLEREITEDFVLSETFFEGERKNSGNAPLDYIQFEGSSASTHKTDINCTGLNIDSLLDFSNSETFDFEELSVLRQNALTGTMDFQDKGVINLAKIYLSNGFIAEANHYIDWIKNKVKKGVLLEVVNLLESNEKGDVKTLQRTSHCSKFPNFWLFLHLPTEVHISNSQMTELLLYYKSFPKELYKFLEPLLSRRLDEVGFREAHSLLNLEFGQQTERRSRNETHLRKELPKHMDNQPRSQLVGTAFLEATEISRVGRKLDLDERLSLEFQVKIEPESPKTLRTRFHLASRHLEDGNIVAALSVLSDPEPSSKDDAFKIFFQGHFFENFKRIIDRSDLLMLKNMPQYDIFLGMLREDQRDELSAMTMDIEDSLIPQENFSLEHQKASMTPAPENISGELLGIQETDPKPETGHHQEWAEFYEILDKSEVVRRKIANLLEF